MNVIQCSNQKEAQLRAGDALEAILREKKEQSVPVLLLLSGGSSFSLLENIAREVLGSHMTVNVLDERFSKDEAINNFAQLAKKPFYELCCSAGVLFIDTRVKENETQADLANRFGKALEDWRETHRDGVVIATMGIGVDGHTAGIMPFPENPALFRQLFEDETKWVVAYDAGSKNQYPLRVTVTLPFLRFVTHAVIYAVGEEKNTALQRVFAKEGSLAETPARIVSEMKNAQLFTEYPLFLKEKRP